MSRYLISIGLAVAALAVAIPLTGCAGLATNLTASTPTQVTTLDEAEQATTLVAKGADTIVNTANVSRTNLLTAQALSKGVSAALAPLETAAANGQSLDFTAINSALSAFQAFQASIATSAPSPSPVASATASN